MNEVNTRTPEEVIASAIQRDAQSQVMTVEELAGQIMRDLQLAGFEVIDTLGDVETEVAEIMAEIRNAEGAAGE